MENMTIITAVKAHTVCLADTGDNREGARVCAANEGKG